MATAPVLIWFRQDLRLDDNPALAWVAATGRPVLPVYILDDQSPGIRPLGEASKWWLHHSLLSLQQSLTARNLPLILRRGIATDVIAELINETGAETIAWNRLYDPGSIARDTAIKSTLKDDGVDAQSFGGAVMYEPWEIETKAGGWYKVYTRYWQANREKGDPPLPVDIPDALTAPTAIPTGDDLDDWNLLPQRPNWAAAFPEYWSPGEAHARARLKAFLDESVNRYDDDRDYPAVPATSRLAAPLHFGEISPRRIWHETLKSQGWTPGTESFLKEVVWREFANHVLYHYPALPEQPLNGAFKAFPWDHDEARLAAWQRGQTGYPMVDAGMRELWQTGTMHNRIRMVVGSFLVKHLLLPWQAGEAWFWDTLVDADLASNSFNWQWVGGCGADAAPYFRIFNPMRQGERFDADGAYVRRWVPELAGLPDKYLHQPWDAPSETLAAAGVTLGQDYPHPIVDHKAARDRALSAFKSIKK